MLEELLRPGPIVLLVFLVLLKPAIRGIRSGKHRMAWTFFIVSTPVLAVCSYLQIHRALKLSHRPVATYPLCAESTGRHRIKVTPPCGSEFPWVDIRPSSPFSKSNHDLMNSNFRIDGVDYVWDNDVPFYLAKRRDPDVPVMIEYEVTDELQKVLSSWVISVEGPWGKAGRPMDRRQNFAWITGGLLAIFALMGVWFQVKGMYRQRGQAPVQG